MLLVFFVAAGCALGGMCRYLEMMMIARICKNAFPWGTLIVNAIGSFLFGIILGRELPEASAPRIYAFGAIGFCGGLTTFSTFILETLSLISGRKWMLAGLNILGSVFVCGLCLIVGDAVKERVLTW